MELAFGVVLGLDHPLEVVQRELGVDGDELLDADHGIYALPALEAVLRLVRGWRQAVAEQVLEQQLAEAAARLGGAQNLLQAGEVADPSQHLRRRSLDPAELFRDVDRGLAGALLAREEPSVEAREPAVDPRVEIRQPPVEAGLDAAQAMLEQPAAAARSPDDGGDDRSRGDKPDEDGNHQPTHGTGAVGRRLGP